MKFAVLAILVLSVVLFGTSCVGDKSIIGDISGIKAERDYYTIGKNLGKVSYMVYENLSKDAKYDKYTKKMEDIYAKFNTDEEPTVSVINQAAMEILGEIIKEKSKDEIKSDLIIEGIRLAGFMLDNMVDERLDVDQANKFLQGFKRGVEYAKSL